MPPADRLEDVSRAEGAVLAAKVAQSGAANPVASAAVSWLICADVLSRRALPSASSVKKK
jgi:hypothetical protein